MRDAGAPSTTAALDAKISDSRSKQKTANVLFVTGAGAAAAGLTLFFVEKRF